MYPQHEFAMPTKVPTSLRAKTERHFASVFGSTIQAVEEYLEFERVMAEYPPVYAEYVMSKKHSHIPTDLQAEWLRWNRAGAYNVVPTNEKTTKYKFYAVAWLCGASWKMIGKLFGVTAATARTSTDKILPVGVRRDMRLATHIISYEQLSAVKESYERLLKELPLFVASGHPVDVAKAVLLEAEWDEPPTSQPSTPTKRVGATQKYAPPKPDTKQPVEDEEVIVDNPMHNVPTGVDPYDPRTWRGA